MIKKRNSHSENCLKDGKPITFYTMLSEKELHAVKNDNAMQKKTNRFKLQAYTSISKAISHKNVFVNTLIAFKVNEGSYVYHSRCRSSLTVNNIEIVEEITPTSVRMLDVLLKECDNMPNGSLDAKRHMMNNLAASARVYLSKSTVISDYPLLKWIMGDSYEATAIVSPARRLEVATHMLGDADILAYYKEYIDARAKNAVGYVSQDTYRSIFKALSLKGLEDLLNMHTKYNMTVGEMLYREYDSRTDGISWDWFNVDVNYFLEPVISEEALEKNKLLLGMAKDKKFRKFDLACIFCTHDYNQVEVPTELRLKVLDLILSNECYTLTSLGIAFDLELDKDKLTDLIDKVAKNAGVSVYGAFDCKYRKGFDKATPELIIHLLRQSKYLTPNMFCNVLRLINKDPGKLLEVCKAVAPDIKRLNININEFLNFANELGRLDVLEEIINQERLTLNDVCVAAASGNTAVFNLYLDKYTGSPDISKNNSSEKSYAMGRILNSVGSMSDDLLKKTIRIVCPNYTNFFDLVKHGYTKVAFEMLNDSTYVRGNLNHCLSISMETWSRVLPKLDAKTFEVMLSQCSGSMTIRNYTFNQLANIINKAERKDLLSVLAEHASRVGLNWQPPAFV